MLNKVSTEPFKCELFHVKVFPASFSGALRERALVIGGEARVKPSQVSELLDPIATSLKTRGLEDVVLDARSLAHGIENATAEATHLQMAETPNTNLYVRVFFWARAEKHPRKPSQVDEAKDMIALATQGSSSSGGGGHRELLLKASDCPAKLVRQTIGRGVVVAEKPRFALLARDPASVLDVTALTRRRRAGHGEDVSTLFTADQANLAGRVSVIPVCSSRVSASRIFRVLLRARIGCVLGRFMEWEDLESPLGKPASESLAVIAMTAQLIACPAVWKSNLRPTSM